MNEVVQLGPFILKGSLLTAVVSFAAALAMIGIRLHFSEEHKKGWLDLFVTNAVVIAICYKFGFLLEDPRILWQNPQALLLTSGGSTAGWLLCAVLAASYTSYCMRKRALRFTVLLDLLPYGLSAGSAAFFALSGAWSFWYAGAAACVAAVLWIWRSPPGEGKALLLFLVWGGIGGMACTLLVPQPGASIRFGLSPLQWLFVGMALAGAACSMLGGRGARG
ncbi:MULTISPECIES: hypothetical protein [unclassified Paenibacillus]|uniref:hypothetical protein n=1 Tax=unclassified Paenibacillus TaxID=185978 RepID=UPI001C0F713C|nr:MULTISPECIES: hypothetical protein [unclassified Paenibacillus]MBU5443326.1 hypothetical protein [Paenibacillus sp. MSJ-34]CAH0118881.1 hypothetical protein PAE9249_01378 [Paenibacillus sp. CECT 9249]